MYHTRKCRTCRAIFGCQLKVKLSSLVWYRSCFQTSLNAADTNTETPLVTSLQLVLWSRQRWARWGGFVSALLQHEQASISFPFPLINACSRYTSNIEKPMIMNKYCLMLLIAVFHVITLVAWHSGITSIFDWHQMVPICTEWWCTEANEATQTHCSNLVVPAYPIWSYYAHGWQRICQEDPVSLPSGKLEKTK